VTALPRGLPRPSITNEPPLSPRRCREATHTRTALAAGGNIRRDVREFHACHPPTLLRAGHPRARGLMTYKLCVGLAATRLRRRVIPPRHVQRGDPPPSPIPLPQASVRPRRRWTARRSCIELFLLDDAWTIPELSELSSSVVRALARSRARVCSPPFFFFFF